LTDPAEEAAMRTLSLFAAIAAGLALTPCVFADDLLPPDRPIDKAIDFYIDQTLKEENVTPAAQADDVVLIRRLTLDLVGRIPTPAEVKAYVESKDPQKRTQLIDRLLASPAHVRHEATEFNTFLMAGTQGNLRDYLLKAFAENRHWDVLFRELILADERNPQTKGSSEFLRQRVADLDKLTTEVSVVFFGVNVSCARCHDHPLVEDWKQDHFFGMKAFFARSYDAGGVLAEREAGLVKFQTTKGVNKQARLMFLTSKVLDDPEARELTAAEQKQEKEALEKAKRSKTPPPAPKVSTRARLIELALQPDQRDFLARAIVNRLWARYYGRGLVAPIDQMHSANPPSHPELLAWLARDLVEHNYDLKRLTRGLVLSQTYSRGSRWDNGAWPKPNLFAVGSVRPLSPMQYATSLRIASTDPQTFAADVKPDELERRLENLENSARGFAPLFEQPTDNFQISATEALQLSNGDRFRKEILADGGDRLLGRLKQLKNSQEVVDLAVRTILSRPPTIEEAQTLGSYLDRRSDRPADAQRQVVWALLTSAEFRFNY
jgi:hypothetical protein